MDRKKIKKDLLMWTFLLVVGIAMITVIIPMQIPVSPLLAKETITPRSFPYLLSVALLVLSVLGIVTSGVKYAKLIKSSEAPGQKAAPMAREELFEKVFPYAIFALILLYGFLFQAVGFVWATLIVPPMILYVLKCRKWYMYLVLYVFAAIIYVIFTVVLHVPLP